MSAPAQLYQARIDLGSVAVPLVNGAQRSVSGVLSLDEDVHDMDPSASTPAVVADKKRD